MPPRSSKTYYDDEDYDDGYYDDYEEYDEAPRGGAKAPSKKPPAAPKPKPKPTPKPSPPAPSRTPQPRDTQSSEGSEAVAPPRPRPKYQDPAKYTHDKQLCTALAARNTGRPSLHIVVLGHVDAGKSTLMGRMVADLGFVDSRTLHKTQQEAQNAGRASFGWAWAFDEREEERARGVTIDVSTRHIETSRFAVTLLDAPGHKDFVPNMISGAAQGDAAILVVDGSRGGFESSFGTGSSRGQTREHIHVARSVGIRQLAVAISKLDTCGYGQERYEEVKAQLAPFLASCGFEGVQWLPVSAPTGQNVSSAPTEAALAAWWPPGRTMVDTIDAFDPVSRPAGMPLRMVVADLVTKPSLSGKVGIAGKVHSGALTIGSSILLLPSNTVATVKALEVQGSAAQVAVAGDSAEVGLMGVEASSVEIGTVACHPAFPVHCSRRLQARILVVDAPRPLIPGTSAVLHMHARALPCRISALDALLDMKNGAVKKSGPAFRVLLKDQAAIVELSLDEELCVEVLEGQSSLSRLVLRIGGGVVALGSVLDILDAERAST